LYFGSIVAPFGSITVVASDEGLCGVSFAAAFAPPTPLVRDDAHPVVVRTLTQLREYLAGTRRQFDLPLVLEGTTFQVAAWRALALVPYGETSSYAAQAANISRPTAARAVGAANSRNPIVIILPCHRIIGSRGALTGFAGGLETKRWLLAHERSVSLPRSHA
jgi:methylated-DNA-[protein]-cysteine S-methyltransferase